jgi:cation diffusion facilitator CzcD-associated flavoprotein CzcO
MGDTVASHWGGQGAGKRVIIIGSGCTGLAIAHGLKKVPTDLEFDLQQLY